jgi:hypothetical protein
LSDTLPAAPLGRIERTDRIPHKRTMILMLQIVALVGFVELG